MIDLDPQTKFQLEQAVCALGLTLTRNTYDSGWRLHSARKSNDGRILITMETADHIALSGYAAHEQGQFVIYLDAPSTATLFFLITQAAFREHEKCWPHAIGL